MKVVEIVVIDNDARTYRDLIFYITIIDIYPGVSEADGQLCIELCRLQPQLATEG